jgi:hypothetical protein
MVLKTEVIWDVTLCCWMSSPQHFKQRELLDFNLQGYGSFSPVDLRKYTIGFLSLQLKADRYHTFASCWAVGSENGHL